MFVEGKIFPYRKKIVSLFEIAGKVLNEDFQNVCVSVNFLNEQEIQNLNLRFRKIDKSTDVLSFPNLDKISSQNLTEFSSERDEDGILFVGDIVICKKIAYKQAREYGHSKNREVCFLALHGLLHLLGYDHIESEDELLMQQKANEILKEFGVER